MTGKMMKKGDRGNESACWTRFKARLFERWSDLSEEELDRYQGRFELVTEVICEKHDEPRNSVRNYIDNLWFEIYVRGARAKHGNPSLFSP